MYWHTINKIFPGMFPNKIHSFSHQKVKVKKLFVLVWHSSIFRSSFSFLYVYMFLKLPTVSGAVVNILVVCIFLMIFFSFLRRKVYEIRSSHKNVCKFKKNLFWKFLGSPAQATHRGSLPAVFFKKYVLKNLAKFTENSFLIKLKLF